MPHEREMKSTAISSFWCLALSLVLAVACRREESAVSARPAPGTNSNGAAATVGAAPAREFAVPFRGTIKGKEQRDLLLNAAEITYTIGNRMIRREAVRTAPLGKLADLGQGSAGIICDLPARRVVLYRTNQEKKRFVRMSVKEYQALISGGSSAGSTTPARALPLLAGRSVYRKHVGTFFTDFPLSEAEIRTVPQERIVAGLPCDLYTARAGDQVLEVSHCQRIRVERELLEMVEVGLPAEVTGFPLLMRRLQLVRVPAPDQGASKSRQLLQKTARWAANVAEKAMQRGFESSDISEDDPPESAFTLDQGFVECPSLEELHRQFMPAEGHHDDWD